MFNKLNCRLLNLFQIEIIITRSLIEKFKNKICENLISCRI